MEESTTFTLQTDETTVTAPEDVEAEFSIVTKTEKVRLYYLFLVYFLFVLR